MAAAFTCSKFNSFRCDRLASSAHGAMVGESLYWPRFSNSNNGVQPAGFFFFPNLQCSRGGEYSKSNDDSLMFGQSPTGSPVAILSPEKERRQCDDFSPKTKSLEIPA